MRYHIVRALPDLWMNQAGSNSHKRGQSPLLLPVKLWFNIKTGFLCRKNRLRVLSLMP